MQKMQEKKKRCVEDTFWSEVKEHSRWREQCMWMLRGNDFEKAIEAKQDCGLLC